MNIEDYSKRREKLRLHVHIGRWAETKLITIPFIKARRKLNKYIRRGQRAYAKLQTGQV